jgi:hypothetical protein
MKILGIEMEDKTALIIGGVALIIGYWTIKKTGDAISSGVHAVGDAINPLSQTNIFNRGVNELGAVITGDNNFSLGSWAWDALHPNEAAGKSVIKQPSGNNGATGGW